MGSTLRSPLELLKAAEPTGPLTESLIFAVKSPLAAGANAAALRIANRGPKEFLPSGFDPLLKADLLTVHGTFHKDSVELIATATFAGRQWAADGAEAVKELKFQPAALFRALARRETTTEGGESAIVNLFSVLATATEGAVVKHDGNAVTVSSRADLGPEVQAWLADMTRLTEATQDMARSASNLRQFGIAFHADFDATRRVVSDSYSPEGKPLLSWRVHLLPYLEEKALYKQFKLDEPWDSETNKKLVEKMPKSYALPGATTKVVGETFYQAFKMKKPEPEVKPPGPRALIPGFPRSPTRPVLLEGKTRGIGFSNIMDGLSNSIFCVEAQDPVTWTKPDDLPFDPNGRLPKLGGHQPRKNGFQALFCDGSVRTLRTKLPEATLKAYITINGGEDIRPD